MKTMIPVLESDALHAIRQFLRQLLESGLVNALFLPLEGEGGSIVPALVTDPEHVNQANPLAPVMPINGARAVSAITGKHAPGLIGAVLRPCEIRALIELVKLQQASLEGVTIIGLDCPGTYEVTDYLEQQRAGKINLPENYLPASEGVFGEGSAPHLRQACQMCVQPVPEHTGIHFQLFGFDPGYGLPVEVDDELAEKIPGLASSIENGDRRMEAVEGLLSNRKQLRSQELAAIQAQLNSNGGIAGLFSACIRCHNCMTVCPICYCKTCLFKTAAFDHAPEHYLTTARRKGALRMMDDSLLFQMTRLNHMSVSCVSCGMCTSACPSDIPVGLIFSAVGAQVQEVFEYLPGRDVAEPLPLITFQPNEWTEIGEEK